MNAEEQRNVPEGTVYLMTPVAIMSREMLLPWVRERSQIRSCEGPCGQPCWFDPVSFGEMPEDNVVKLCFTCLRNRIKPS